MGMSYLAVIRPSGRARIGFFFFSLFHFDMQCFLVFCSFSVLVLFVLFSLNAVLAPEEIGQLSRGYF